MARGGKSGRTERGRAANRRATTDRKNRGALSPLAQQRPWLVGAMVVGFLALGIALRVRELAADPRVYFLSNEAGAEWIRADVPFWLKAYSAAKTVTAFRYVWTAPATVEHAHLTVRAFRRATVTLDDQPLDPGTQDLDEWKEARTVALPSPLQAGPHVLRITVSNRDAHSCLLAYSKELGLWTSPAWEAAPLPQSFRPAIAATEPRPPELVREYEAAWKGLGAISPWLGGIFAAVLLETCWGPAAEKWALGRRLRITPPRMRWLLAAAWVILAANDIWRLPPHLGFDVDRHFDYVKYIATQHALPLASDGWQMFQPPLFYLLAAPWYAVLSPFVGDEVLIKVLRFLPLFCGLAQIEIVYRTARAVFPDKGDLQIVATLVGGLLPMQIYISLVIGNEPLAGCLTAVVILMCFLLLAQPASERRPRFFVWLGVVWGLAILSKVTPLLLTPLVAFAVVWHARFQSRPSGFDESRLQEADHAAGANRERWSVALARLAWVFGACFLTAGWFFLRNWLALGKPLILGGGDAANEHAWWQDPSYRTAGQLVSFGSSLARPVYSGAWSLWDSLYSTMWLDGLVSGSISNPARVPWNLRWMEAGAWLALVPMALLAAGLLSPLRKDARPSRPVLCFALAAIGIYLAAMVDIYLRMPIYSTAKATYTLGLLPCYGVLAGAGAEPLLRFRWLRGLVFAALACWAAAAYAAYFVR
jgi:Dolichyl-phosphate-mannose-protein mannosyltransferase